MAITVVVIVVAAVALAYALVALGVVGQARLQTAESIRKSLAVVWWLLIAVVFLFTGIFALQLVGFVLLLYMALVALEIYDLSVASFRDMVAKPLEVIR